MVIILFLNEVQAFQLHEFGDYILLHEFGDLFVFAGTLNLCD
jgi:hypothetical protein